jgi:hypothetical protein
MWINLVQRLAEAVQFFNPALWYLSRRISTLREYCCDEMTCRAQLASAAEPRVRYATALLRVVELTKPNIAANNDLASLAASGRSPSEVRRRVARLFGEPLREPLRISRGGVLGLILLGAALTIGLPVWNTQAESSADHADLTILTAAGEHAANAKIALGVAHSKISVENGDIDDRFTHATRLNADANGRFSIPVRDEPFELVITHPLGFAHLRSTNGSIPNRITLTPWARVQGTFHIGAQPAPNVVLTISSKPIHSHGDGTPNNSTHYRRTTDEDGRFVFERVFPGKGRIGRRVMLMVDADATEVASSQMVSAEFSAGNTTTLDLTGMGRPVVGELALSADAERKDPHDMLDHLITGLQAERRRLRQGVFRVHGVELREDSAPVGKLEGPVRMLGAFDFDKGCYRFDRDRPSWIVAGKESRRLDRKICRTPKLSAHYFSEYERLEIHPPDTVNPGTLSDIGGYLDVRCVGLYSFGQLFKSLDVEPVCQRLLTLPLESTCVDEGDGIFRLDWIYQGEKRKYEKRTTRWIDTNKGFAPIRLEARHKFVDAGDTKWRAPFQTTESTWTRIADVWVPSSYRVFLQFALAPEKRAEPLDGKQTSHYRKFKYRYTFEWESVNEPVDEAYFDYKRFDLPSGTRITGAPRG